MVRPSFNAPVGNPTQVDKQPRQKLDLEFLYTGDSIAHTREVRWRILFRIIIADFTVLMFTCFAGPPFYGFLAFCAVSYFLLWAIHAIDAGEVWGVLRGAVVILVAGVCALLSFRAPGIMLLLMAVLLGIHSHGIGSHWINRCTTSPLPLDAAREIRQQWKGHLLIVSLVPFLAAIVTIVFQKYWLFPMLLITFSGIQLIFCQDIYKSLRAGFRALSSWCAYNADNVVVPGLSQSPAGAATTRQMRIVGDTIAFAVLCVMLSFATAAPPLMPMVAFFLFPGLAFVVIPLLMLAPLLEEAALHREKSLQEYQWEHVVTEVRRSPNPVVRDSYFMGTVAADGSPLLVSRDVFNEPSHFLGSTGAGKTSKGLSPWIEQTIGFGDSSLIMIDLKADTLETLATMVAAEENLRRTTGTHLPLKIFSSQNHLATHGFNPLGFDFWNQFSLYQRTDILCGALGLIYGSDYGEGYYSSANAETCYETLRCFPQLRNFRELAERCYYVLTHPDKFELLPNTAKNADHLYSQLKRLADFEQLQTCADGRFTSDVIENSIDLTDLFRRPQMVYLHLSSSLGAGSAPAIARLFTYMLLTAATQTERRCKVYLVIDEFQRMVADNLEYILQLARSMGVGIVLANQSMSDLRSRRADMISILETNCRYRQWFDVPAEEDRKRLMAVAGETIEHLETDSVSNSKDGVTISNSQAQVILPRLNINEILHLGDDPELSVVRITRGGGYAQFGGLPTVIRSGFHITQEEYERRKAFTWPELTPGMFIPSQLTRQPMSDPRLRGPKFIREIGGTEVTGKDTESPNIGDLFEGLPDVPPKKSGKRRRKPE